MAAERPAKACVRELWVDAVRRRVNEPPVDGPPLYLTLPGAEARDIGALIEHGLIRITETGAIHSDDLRKCVAIESRPAAVVELQRRIPGLKILQQDLKSLLGGVSLVRWPLGEHETFFRALVVNLDFNSPLVVSNVAGHATFPALELVRKLVTLHANAEPVDWTLCLTLNGSVNWPADQGKGAQAFLAENFDLDPDFAESAQSLLGGRLFGRIVANQDLSLTRLARENQQRFLMIYVPKVLAGYARDSRWRARTRHNLRYGEEGEAPMVTWIVDFELDRDAAHTPAAIYRDSLRTVLAGAGRIEQDGSLLCE